MPGGFNCRSPMNVSLRYADGKFRHFWQETRGNMPAAAEVLSAVPAVLFPKRKESLVGLVLRSSGTQGRSHHPFLLCPGMTSSVPAGEKGQFGNEAYPHGDEQKQRIDRR